MFYFTRPLAQRCFLHRVVVGVASLIASLSMTSVGAQRLLTVPDLSAFVGETNANLSLDTRRGWVYASSEGNRAMGIETSGIARFSPEGFIDAYWKPTGMIRVQSHAVAPNGDVYVLGIQDFSLIAHIARYLPTRGGEPVARIYAGNEAADKRPSQMQSIVGITAQWLYFVAITSNPDSTQTQWIGRADIETNKVDERWRWTWPKNAGYINVIASESGAVSVSWGDYSSGSLSLWVARINTTESEKIVWTRPLVGAYSHVTIAADSSDRLYVAARDDWSATVSAVVIRLSTIGLEDSTWNGLAASRAFAQSSRNSQIAVIADEVLVDAATTNVPSAGHFPALAKFDERGTKTAQWASGTTSSFARALGVFANKLYVYVDREVRLLEPRLLREAGSFPAVLGDASNPGLMLRLPDGGYLLRGNFSVFYSGVHVRDMLRLRPDGTPDLRWRPDVSSLYGTQLVTPNGVIFRGYFARVNDVPAESAKLVSLDSGAELPWGADGKQISNLAVYDGKTFVYDLRYSNDGGYIERINAATGIKDPSWTIPLPYSTGDVLPASLSCDASGGIWVFRRTEAEFLSTEVTKELQRFDIASRAQTYRGTADYTQRNESAVTSTTTHAYVGTRRYDLTRGGTLDPQWTLGPAWNSFPSSPRAIGRYLYFFDFSNDAESGPISALRRAPLNGTGTPEAGAAMRLGPVGGVLPRVLQIMADPASTSGDDAMVLLSYQGLPLLGGGPRRNVWATTRDAPLTAKNVVEYFNRDVGRYFITGRPAEQASLDALPQSFRRTGMSFSAQSSEYRDLPEQPVCRLYAPSAVGGSNTHFYGTGDDCPALNTVRQLSFEGFDFAAIKPVDGACPSGASKPVYRLFNNRAATNNGNHRYVVSDATRMRMQLSGWVDEGVVFCTTGVTDATP
jgi:hypothetical protein